MIGERGRILAYTIGNDVSSREIEGTNPLYLSQAKVYAAACAIGPALYIPPREPQGFQIIMRISDEDGEVLYEDKTSTTNMVRTFEELTAWLVKENPVPPGSVLLTDLDRQYPGLRFRVVDEQSRLRQHMVVWIGQERCRDLTTPVDGLEELVLMQALSGG